jgi:YesN/AraC family two-component response regulator
MMKLFIKNINSEEEQEWLKQNIDALEIDYLAGSRPGEMIISKVSIPKIEALKKLLEENGFSFIGDRKYTLAEKIKHVVMDMLTSPESPRENYSSYISNRIGLNYVYLANIFSEFNNITIEHFIINQKIEKAKDLLLNTNYNIGQIADTLNYSSIGHFSNQFKKVLGINPTEFKKMEKQPALA